MNVRVTLERKGETRFTQVRQMFHDTPIRIGDKMKWGSGAKWLITDISW